MVERIGPGFQPHRRPPRNTGQPLMEAPDPDVHRLMRLDRELREVEGWPIYSMLRNLARSWDVFDENWQELDGKIGRFKTDTRFALPVGERDIFPSHL